MSYIHTYRENFIKEEALKNDFPATFDYLSGIRNRLSTRGSASMKYENWYAYWNKRNLNNIYARERLITPDVCYGCTFAHTNSNEVLTNDTIYSLTPRSQVPDLYSYLAILNSNLTWFFLITTGSVLRGGYFRFKTNYLKNISFPTIKTTLLRDKASKLTMMQSELHSLRTKLFLSVSNDLIAQKRTRKLESWYELSYPQFEAELVKNNVAITQHDTAKWRDNFSKQKVHFSSIQANIEKLEDEINALVYELYGLTDEEIRIVEGAL